MDFEFFADFLRNDEIFAEGISFETENIGALLIFSIFKGKIFKQNLNNEYLPHKI